MPDTRDSDLRRAALDQVRELQRTYSDLIPVSALASGFTYEGRRVSFGSFYSGIFSTPRSCRGRRRCFS